MTLKQKLHGNAPFHIGALSLDLTRDGIERRASGKGWDLAFMDLQHAAYSEPQLVDVLRCSTELGAPIMLRIPHPQALWQIGRLLDFGAAGVLVPMVEDPGTVKQAVENAYYPPLGKRSCGLRYAYGWDTTMTPRSYADWWNENGVLAIQIETVQAVLDIRRLVQPGVDLILFGAVDLSFSLAATPDCPLASVRECQDYVVEKTRDLEVRVGVADLPFGQF